MSTIHTAVDWSGKQLAANLINRMMTASSYWQPDFLARKVCQQGRWAQAKACLYNTRQSKSDHIISNDTANISVCANARLDNRNSLMEELSIPVARRKALTDGHLILAAYSRWGEDCAAHLLGDFVFILWDQSREKLVCARDQLGIKILFYFVKEKIVLVSNEHNALLETGIVNKTIAEKWLVESLWSLGRQRFASPYSDIHVLPAAHTLVIDDHGSRIKRYWQIQENKSLYGRKHQDLLEELDYRFKLAVRRRLNTDYALGAELSGGLDSCGIVGAAAQQLKSQNLYTFSYECIQETEQNRSVWGEPYRDIYAMHALHHNLSAVWTAPGNDKRFFDAEQMKRFEQIFGGPLVLIGGNFLRPALAKIKGVRTLLSGWGGDHCVSSYGDYYESELFRQGKFSEVHRFFKQLYEHGYGSTATKAWAALLLKHATPSVYNALVIRRNGLGKALIDKAKNHFLKREYRQQYNCDNHLLDYINQYAGYTVRERDRRELVAIESGHRLLESELCGRIHRVEFRFPMLDVELLEFAYNVPPQLKIFQGIERYMFRQLLDGVTTENIRWRRKADVKRPQRDRFNILCQYTSQLFAGFDAQNSPIAQHYCDIDSLLALIENPIPGLRKGINVLTSIDGWLEKGVDIAIG